ncbi:hypothetical protein GUJ93_ZPchr0006g42994 [Zizania palustris]|uniref:Uncharacterized protein n=1 Tax=Zizania palustris TaxID=103762 RepID=A0A8J5T6I9_ZIZPA|nr:hypothetical protein GUJ93_ZPchr0006g42994 [Zizania palustris]
MTIWVRAHASTTWGYWEHSMHGSTTAREWGRRMGARLRQGMNRALRVATRHDRRGSIVEAHAQRGLTMVGERGAMHGGKARPQVFGHGGAGMWRGLTVVT